MRLIKRRIFRLSERFLLHPSSLHFKHLSSFKCHKIICVDVYVFETLFFFFFGLVEYVYLV